MDDILISQQKDQMSKRDFTELKQNKDLVSFFLNCVLLIGTATYCVQVSAPAEKIMAFHFRQR